MSSSALAIAITARSSRGVVAALDALADELGIDALIDVLLALPEPDASFVRAHVDVRSGLRREFREAPIVLKTEHAVRFVVPSGDLEWNEMRGAWDVLS